MYQPRSLMAYLVCFFLLLIRTSLAYSSSLPASAPLSSEDNLTHKTPIKSSILNTLPLENVSQSPEWKALLHYQPQGLMSREYSEVDDEKFFLSANGKHNPYLELKATIHAFQSKGVGNNAAQCRFPARFQYIQQVFPQLMLQAVECPEFQAWYDGVFGSELYLIFPSSYINSPSSMYGHSLFRLDGKQGHKLLSSAINFAAFTDADDDELTYSVKGLTGGYPGYVSLVPYYEKVNTYSHIESRDIWEYKLNISEDKLDKFVRHIWELDKIRFDYFFIDENCSYRLLTILDAVDPSWKLTEPFKYRTVPSDTIRILAKKGLIDDVTFRPSKTTIIESQRLQLTPQQRDISRALADDPFSTENHEAYLALADDDKARVLDLAYGYTRYLALKKKVNDPALPKRSFKLLSMRASVPVQGNKFLPPVVPSVRDEQGHDTRRWTFTAGEEYAEVGFRLNYHGWLDNVAGYREGAEIEMGNWVVRAEEDLRLETFEILSIRSVGPRHQFSHPISWQVKTGYERWNTDDVGQSYVRVGGGLAYPLSHDLGAGSLYGMAVTEAAISDRYQDDWRLGVGPEIGYLLQWQPLNIWLSAERLASVGTQGASTQLQFSTAYNPSLKQQVRLQWQYQAWRDDHDHDIRLSYVLYH